MLNEDKMKLMTGIALFEKREGKRIFPANRYFRSDYISLHLFRSFFSYTFCYALGIGVWAMYNADYLFSVMEPDVLISDVRNGILLYFAGLIPYLILTGVIYAKRYGYAQRGMDVYLAKLKRLSHRYEVQNRANEMTKEKRRHENAPGN